MIYHFVVGDEAGNRLKEAVATEPAMAGEVIVLRDILHVGPLKKTEGQGFSELRMVYWQGVASGEKTLAGVDDMERLLEVSAKMFRDDSIQAWIWMAPCVADVCAYYWLLPYLSKHKGRFYIVNIAGLPFLNEAGKVYFPKNISEIMPRELVKARRLSRQVTPGEIEIDGDEWRRLADENGGVRTWEGGKKIASHPADYYDTVLLGLCTAHAQKTNKVVRQALQKHNLPTGDLWLYWRLREMANAGAIEMQGEEVRLPGVGTTAESTPAQESA